MRVRRRYGNRIRAHCCSGTSTQSSTSNARFRSISSGWRRTTDKILIDGNTATALGCVYAGATVAAWYPITPATSVMDAFKEFCERFRKDPETGKNNYVILQAEDEIAAIGMVIGAMWNGARAFTSTAGPGISLMNELLGLAYYAEIPGRGDRCAAGRAFDRNADTNAAGRHPRMRIRVSRRYEAHPALSSEPGRVF